MFWQEREKKMFLYNQTDPDKSPVILWEGFDLNQVDPKRLSSPEGRADFIPFLDEDVRGTGFSPLGSTESAHEGDCRSANEKENLLEIEKKAYERVFHRAKRMVWNWAKPRPES